MFQKVLFICLCLLFANAYSQKILSGKIFSENNLIIGNVVVLNMRTQEKTTTNINGEFIIKAANGDGIRLVKEGYDRKEINISQNDFSSAGITIVLAKTPIIIEEVKLRPSLSGILNKDSQQLNESSKKAVLNSEMRKYVKENPIEVEPPKFESVQVSLLGISSGGATEGIVGQIIQLISSPKISQKNNYAYRKTFLNNIKKEIDLSYFENYGMSEYEFDQYLSYADSQYQLYDKRYTAKRIQEIMKNDLSGYLNRSKK